MIIIIIITPNRRTDVRGYSKGWLGGGRGGGGVEGGGSEGAYFKRKGRQRVCRCLKPSEFEFKALV